jgi:hypothetical protein
LRLSKLGHSQFKWDSDAEAAYGRETMEWFSRKTSIAGIQFSNGHVLSDIIVMWIIYITP